MDSVNLGKWRDLLLQIEVHGKLYPASIEEIFEYEKQSSFTLPKAYKGYCQVFGSGGFDHNSFYIAAPPWSLMPDPDRIEACKNAYDYPPNILELLDSAHVFGIAECYVFFFFDSRTYNKMDESYDIYGVGDGLNAVYKLTRDFFEFIRDYCIGTKAEKYPQLIAGIPSDYFETGRYQNNAFHGAG